MPSYLQKLVARAGAAAPFATSLQPALRAQAESGPLDQLPEVVEPSFLDLSPPSKAPQIVAPAVSPTQEASVHTVEFRNEAIAPPPQVIRERMTERVVESRVEPKRVPNTPVEVPPIIKVSTQAEIKEAPSQNPKLPQLKTTENYASEHNVLSKLMPQLEAWFNQPSRAEAQSESPITEARIDPPRRETEPAPSLRQEEARLVIGQIRVDVLPTPPPAPSPSPRVVRVPIRSGQSSAVAGTIAKLGFGLGQM